MLLETAPAEWIVIRTSGSQLAAHRGLRLGFVSMPENMLQRKSVEIPIRMPQL